MHVRSWTQMAQTYSVLSLSNINYTFDSARKEKTRAETSHAEPSRENPSRPTYKPTRVPITQSFDMSGILCLACIHAYLLIRLFHVLGHYFSQPEALFSHAGSATLVDLIG